MNKARTLQMDNITWVEFSRRSGPTQYGVLEEGSWGCWSLPHRPRQPNRDRLRNRRRSARSSRA